MQEFKNKEEYEDWKAKKLEAAREGTPKAASGVLNKKCPSCSMQIPLRAKVCPFCNKKLGWTTRTKTGFLLILLIIFLAWLGSLDFGLNEAPQREAISTPKEGLTVDQHISEARRALGEGYRPNDDIMKTAWGDVAKAEEHLRAINHYDNEQQKVEAERLMKEVEWRKEKIEQVAEVVAKKIMIQQRERIAKNLDRVFLDKGMDVQVILEGEYKDTLILKWVLWNRVTVYGITKDGTFLSNLQKAGFKRIDFSNNFNYHVYYELTPNS